MLLCSPLLKFCYFLETETAQSLELPHFVHEDGLLPAAEKWPWVSSAATELEHPRTVHRCEERQIEGSRRSRRQYKRSSCFARVLLLLTSCTKVRFLHFRLFIYTDNHHCAQWRLCVPKDFVCDTKSWLWSDEAILLFWFKFSIIIIIVTIIIIIGLSRAHILF